MMNAKMKRVGLVIARADFENVLHEIISLGCVEITDPDELPEYQQLSSLTVRETVELDKYNANQGSIALLGTQYTVLLTGWITARSETELVAQLLKYVCSWEIESPSPDEHDKIPVALRCPKFFGAFYKGDGRTFNPLQSSDR